MIGRGIATPRNVEDSGMRRFSGIVWLDAAQERFSLVAASWDEAVAFLKEQYGSAREFLLTDEEAAQRQR
jgi:hypothetical protein